MTASVISRDENSFTDESTSDSSLNVPTFGPIADSAAGDLVVVAVTVLNVNSSTNPNTIALPAGWTHAGHKTAATSNKHVTYFFYRVLDAGDIATPYDLVAFEYWFGESRAMHVAIWAITGAQNVTTGSYTPATQTDFEMESVATLEAAGNFQPFGSASTCTVSLATTTTLEDANDTNPEMRTAGIVLQIYVAWDDGGATAISLSGSNPAVYDWSTHLYAGAAKRALSAMSDEHVSAGAPASLADTIEIDRALPYYVATLAIEDGDAGDPGPPAGPPSSGNEFEWELPVPEASEIPGPPPDPVAIIALDVEDGATLTYSWLTVVREMWSGRETRASLVRAPRQRFAFTAKLTDQQYRAVIGTLASESAAAPTFLLALAQEDLAIESSTSSSITVHSLAYCDWAVDGQRIVIVGPDGDQIDTTIDGAPVGAVIGTTDNVSAVAVQGARVMPLVEVYLEPDQDLDRRRVNMGSWRIAAVAAENGYGGTTEWGVGATVATHDSIPVWDRGIALGNASQPLGSDISPIDAGLGVSALGKRALPFWKRAIRIESSEVPEWQWFKAFLMTVLGQHRTFLLPTGRPDLVPESDASTGTLTISGANYVDDWFPSTAHRRIRIVLADGTAAYRTITSCEDNGDGTQDLVLATSLAGAIDRIEFLETVRLDSDEVSVRFQGWNWESQLVAKVVQRGVDVDPETFDDFETGEETGRPREIYIFELDGATTPLTSSKEDETYDSVVYTATPGLSRGNVMKTPLGQEREVTVTLPLSHAIAQDLLGNGIPPRAARLTIQKFHGTTDLAYQVFDGELAEITTDDQYAHIRMMSSLDIAFDVKLPVLRADRYCQHALYGPGCQATRVDAEVAVATVTGTTITVGLYLEPDGWADGGEMVNIATGEARTILSQVGNVFVVDVPFRDLAFPDHVNIAPGCDGVITTCRDKFDNVVNFGGHPHLPEVNPTEPAKPKGLHFWDKLFGE